MGLKQHHRDLLAHLINFGEEIALVKRAHHHDNRALLHEQILTTTKSHMGAALLACLAIWIAGILLYFGADSAFGFAIAAVYTFVMVGSYQVYCKARAFEPDEETADDHLTRLTWAVSITALCDVICWSAVLYLIWSIQAPIADIMVTGLSTAVIGIGALIYMGLPSALISFVFLMTLASLLIPSVAGRDLEWMYYAGMMTAGWFIFRLAMQTWRSFIETSMKSHDYARQQESFFTLENERLRELETEKLKSATAKANAIAEGDASRREEMDILARHFEGSVHNIVDALSAAVHTVGETSQQLASIGLQTRERTDSMSDMAKNMSNAIQSVAAASRQLTGSADAISSQIDDQVTASKQAQSISSEGSEVIKRLASEADRVNEIAAMIQEVAGQTNLLALNATIEAARAGDAGRGFSIVAQEVKSLAGQTQGAIESVTTTVANIRGEMAHAAQTVGSVVDQIGQVQDGASNIASAISQQHAATREISSNAEQAANNAGKVLDYSREVNTAALQIGEVADEMRQIMADLEKRSLALRDASGEFLGRLRSA